MERVIFMETLVTDLAAGDRFTYMGVTVTVIEPAVPTNDPFGRSGFSRLLASRSDTSGIGTMLFGQGASVEKVSCIDGCTGHPDLPDGWTSWQEALHSDLSGAALAAWKTSEPVARAAALGHDVEPLDTALEDDMQWRWVCRRCRDVVIIYETNIYGAAVTYECTGGSS